MKKPRPCLARWGLHDLTELPAMSNRSSSVFKPSRHRGQAPGSCRGHQLSPIQSSAVPPPGFLNTDWRSGFADSNP